MADSALLSILREMIQARGGISVGEYMALCLGHPQYGYYMAREPFGQNGDFTTAPEISQLFGEMIAVWVAAQWEALDRSPDIQLVEFGPGRGTLMADLWRGLSAVPALRDNVSIHLVEFSPRLQQAQKEKLRTLPVTWHTSFETVPERCSLIIANEFFDALPIEQAIFHNGNWHQRLITLSPRHSRAGGDPLSYKATSQQTAEWTPACAGDTESGLAFGLGAQLKGIFIDNAKEGDIFEYAPPAAEIMDTICAFLQKNKGSLLAFDYGDTIPVDRRLGETLQALYDKRPDPILAHPGEADLTAHVAFAALQDIALAQGLNTAIQSQREFLTQHGIRLRAEKLLARATPEQAAHINTALHRLLDPAEMGDLFKALQIINH